MNTLMDREPVLASALLGAALTAATIAQDPQASVRTIVLSALVVLLTGLGARAQVDSPATRREREAQAEWLIAEALEQLPPGTIYADSWDAHDPLTGAPL